MKKFNYHLINPDRCCVCINVKRPAYPFDWKCKVANYSIVSSDGICDKFERDLFWIDK